MQQDNHMDTSKVIQIPPNDLCLPSSATIAEIKMYIKMNPSFKNEIEILTCVMNEAEYLE